MSPDKYTKFVLTVIAFSLFWIALNLSVLEFVLYKFYNGKIEVLISEISNQTTEISLRINEFYSRVAEISLRIDEISSRTDELIDAIKKRK
jgi:methyl-accepting chemotaxis protein